MSVRSFVLVVAIGCLGAALSAAFAETEPRSVVHQTLKGPSEFEPIGDEADRSRAIFAEIGKLLTHPRCMSCHPAGDHRPGSTVEPNARSPRPQSNWVIDSKFTSSALRQPWPRSSQTRVPTPSASMLFSLVRRRSESTAKSAACLGTLYFRVRQCSLQSERKP